MKQKILSFITDGEKFLALRNNPENPEKHGGDFWFVVTGGINKNESFENAVQREIKEETDLDVKEVFNLNWGSVYDSWQGVCKEFNFLSFVKKASKINLDMIERVEYQWLNLEKFANIIKWDDDKELLKQVLQKALKKEKYFKRLNIETNIKFNKKEGIIDAHLHLPILKKNHTLEKAKNKLVLDMKKNKINHAILIPDNLHGSKIGNLDDCLKLIKNSKNLFLLGTIDIQKEGKDSIKKLDFLFKEKRIKGIKIFPGHDPIYPTDKRLIPIYKLCDKYNLPIVIHTGENSKDSKLGKYNDPKLIVKIAKRFPNLKILICHYFNPKIEYCYNTTKNYPNIYFDTSALAHQEVLKMSGEKILKKFLKKTILERPGNVLFGSDYACDGCNMADHINLIKSLNLSNKINKEVFYKNAINLFKLDF